MGKLLLRLLRDIILPKTPGAAREAFGALRATVPSAARTARSIYQFGRGAGMPAIESAKWATKTFISQAMPKALAAKFAKLGFWAAFDITTYGMLFDWWKSNREASGRPEEFDSRIEKELDVVLSYWGSGDVYSSLTRDPRYRSLIRLILAFNDSAAAKEMADVLLFAMSCVGDPWDTNSRYIIDVADPVDVGVLPDVMPFDRILFGDRSKAVYDADTLDFDGDKLIDCCADRIAMDAIDTFYALDAFYEGDPYKYWKLKKAFKKLTSGAGKIVKSATKVAGTVLKSPVGAGLLGAGLGVGGTLLAQKLFGGSVPPAAAAPEAEPSMPQLAFAAASGQSAEALQQMVPQVAPIAAAVAPGYFSGLGNRTPVMEQALTQAVRGQAQGTSARSPEDNQKAGSIIKWKLGETPQPPWLAQDPEADYWMQYAANTEQMIADVAYQTKLGVTNRERKRGNSSFSAF